MSAQTNFKSVSFRLTFVLFLCFFTVDTHAIPALSGLFGPDPVKTKIEQVLPGMTKYDVKNLLGAPYKYSFYTNEKQEMVEELFYKTSYILGYTFHITYRVVIVNSYVTALLQEEKMYQTPNVVVENK